MNTVKDVHIMYEIKLTDEQYENLRDFLAMMLMSDYVINDIGLDMFDIIDTIFDKLNNIDRESDDNTFEPYDRNGVKILVSNDRTLARGNTPDELIRAMKYSTDVDSMRCIYTGKSGMWDNAVSDIIYNDYPRLKEYESYMHSTHKTNIREKMRSIWLLKVNGLQVLFVEYDGWWLLVAPVVETE